MTVKNEFFEDLSVTYESWLNDATQAFTDENADLIWTDDASAFEVIRSALKKSNVAEGDVRQVLSEILRGQIISFLAIIDGATKLAEKEKIELVDSKGTVVCSDLHDEFVSYLLETNRMK